MVAMNGRRVHSLERYKRVMGFVPQVGPGFDCFCVCVCVPLVVYCVQCVS